MDWSFCTKSKTAVMHSGRARHLAKQNTITITNTNTNTNANTNATTSIDYGLRFLYQKQNTGHALGAC